MPIKSLFLFLLCLFLSVAAYAQFENELPEYPLPSQPRESRDFWILSGGETAMYGVSSMAYGGSLALGYGNGTAIGLKAAWFFSPEGTTTLEINFLFRFYFLGRESSSGPFAQFSGGPALFFAKDEIVIPSQTGMISAGLSFGWRFIFAEKWFAESSIRAGYPFLGGAGVAAGMRF